MIYSKYNRKNIANDTNSVVYTEWNNIEYTKTHLCINC